MNDIVDSEISNCKEQTKKESKINKYVSKNTSNIINVVPSIDNMLVASDIDLNIVQNDDNLASNVAVTNQTENNIVKEDLVSKEKRNILQND